MKYRVIKDFPGNGEKIDDIIKLHKGTFPEYFGPSGKRYFAKDIENYPEFLQKVKELDYEILSFTLNSDCDLIRYKNTFGMFPSGSKLQAENGNKFNSFSEQSLLDDKAYFIHSIKRLSDGTIFGIGDKIICQNAHSQTPSAITKIELNKEGNIVLFTHAFYKNGINMYKANHQKVLFTTEDGADVNKGDKCWFVEKAWTKYSFKVDCQSVGNNIFSTEENAQAYIDENKPKYSERELLKFADYFKVNYLITTPVRVALQMWKFKK